MLVTEFGDLRIIHTAGGVAIGSGTTATLRLPNQKIHKRGVWQAVLAAEFVGGSDQGTTIGRIEGTVARVWRNYEVGFGPRSVVLNLK